jgi:hypothetical protein
VVVAVVVVVVVVAVVAVVNVNAVLGALYELLRDCLIQFLN